MRLRTGKAADAGMSSEMIDRVATLARGWVAGGDPQALVVLVARRGVIVLHEAHGRLKPDADAPVLALDAIFPLTSISKPITATAAMILLEDGLLGLNRPVVEYIPEFVGEGKEGVLVRHLLTHTSGLRDEQVRAHATEKRDSTQASGTPSTQHPAIHDYLIRRYEAPLWKLPGVEMSYSAVGFELLGEIVRRVSGLSLSAFAEERIFGPLGMRDTRYVLPEAEAKRAVRRAPDVPFASTDQPEYQTTPWAAGGVSSTAMDMAVFCQMMLNGGVYGGMRVLSPASVAAMTRNQIPGIGADFFGERFPEASWGLGWDVSGDKIARYASVLHSPRTFSHLGSGGVGLWVNPVCELVGVYFSVSQKDGLTLRWPLDHFMDLVTAAVIEA